MTEYEYVVMGSGVVRSIGLSYPTALKYAAYYKEINPKARPIIKKVSKEELHKRFMERYHNTPEWRKKVKSLGNLGY